MRALYLVVPALAVVALGAANAVGEERQGRYTMSPVDGGFARLDTETGAMSTCARRDSKWVCEPMSDEAEDMRKEIERLRAENRRLQALAAPPKEGEADRPAERFELPSEQDVDKAFDYVERIFRKFRERLKQLEKEDEGKGTPL